MNRITLGPGQLETIIREAENALPRECCGLLVGTRAPDDGIGVVEVVPSRNVAPDERLDRFEVDPAVRFEAMRRLERTSLEIVGHYHSHPDHPPVPSQIDLEMAFEPEFAWLIAGLKKGRVRAVRAFRLRTDGRAFEPMVAEPGSYAGFRLPARDRG